MTARTTFSTSTPERGVSQRGGTGPGRAEPGPVRLGVCMLRVYAWMGCGTVDAAWAITVRGRGPSVASYPLSSSMAVWSAAARSRSCLCVHGARRLSFDLSFF